jgi:Ni,Fe-hydrogenase I cytochrome b subunit
VLPSAGFFISRPIVQPQSQFSKEITKATKVRIFLIINFVLFASFTLKFAFSFLVATPPR